MEHPVTEQITGVDIIKEQLHIAAGEPMRCASRAPFSPNGHAIEFRINAEDPDNDFRPSPSRPRPAPSRSSPSLRRPHPLS